MTTKFKNIKSKYKLLLAAPILFSVSGCMTTNDAEEMADSANNAEGLFIVSGVERGIRNFNRENAQLRKSQVNCYVPPKRFVIHTGIYGSRGPGGPSGEEPEKPTKKCKNR